ncbi:DUF1127 domain-containing protein [Cochlodiniinecator piscidefendens]|uniref:DUF1127 domain-containing protein n=1 Tax=Cochlodiniinecator piscidefendens TaxID=2715756 RepID=UPI001E52583E|nr:DUF1127 domain-containing protein [Cochlodiniinecator piscidefendens]
MALAATTQTAPKNIFRRIGSFFNMIAVATMENNDRMRAIRHLQAKSDQELADIGMKREDIVRHVFSSLYYS